MNGIPPSLLGAFLKAHRRGPPGALPPYPAANNDQQRGWGPALHPFDGHCHKPMYLTAHI